MGSSCFELGFENSFERGMPPTGFSNPGSSIGSAISRSIGRTDKCALGFHKRSGESKHSDQRFLKGTYLPTNLLPHFPPYSLFPPLPSSRRDRIRNRRNASPRFPRRSGDPPILVPAFEIEGEIAETPPAISQSIGKVARRSRNRCRNRRNALRFHNRSGKSFGDFEIEGEIAETPRRCHHRSGKSVCDFEIDFEIAETPFDFTIDRESRFAISKSILKSQKRPCDFTIDRGSPLRFRNRF